MVRRYLGRIKRPPRHITHKYIPIGVGAVLFLVAAYQCLYPWNNIPLYVTIDSVPVGGKSIDEATRIMKKAYAEMPLQLYFGDSKAPYRQPKPADIGLTIETRNQAEAMRYPWWLRLIPTSLWWAHYVAFNQDPVYKYDKDKAAEYVKKELGESCKVEPRNASVAYEEGELTVAPALDGGTCEFDKVVGMLTSAKPRISMRPELRIQIDAHRAAVTDKMAGDFVAKLSARTAAGLTINIGDMAVPIEQETLLGWLDFKAPDSGIAISVNVKKSEEFFAKKVTPKLSKKAGTTHVTTVDFTETSRNEGVSGQTLDTASTIELIEAWLKGSDGEVRAKVKIIPPKVVYTRKYSATDTGLAALLKHFAESHSGVYGIKYAELGGKHRHAGYNETRVFETASTYKLYVAYGTLKRIESGKWKWTDKNIHGGRNMAKCFDDMIVISDNECAHALLDKIGYKTLTNEIHALGLTRSSFMHSYIETTPGDLGIFLGLLASGQLLSPSSNNTLISAMKRNVFRSGVPSGTGSQVADKVGFLQGHISGVSGTIYLLHDAAIVYSPKGTYVLAVMTGGSSWGTIAELTKKIEAWRNSN